MELKTIIHFYSFCDFIVAEKDYWLRDKVMFIHEDGEVWGRELECLKVDEIKLILRHISTMTANEFVEYNKLRERNFSKPTFGRFTIGEKDTPQSLAWLILNRFDVYGLIGQHFAIDERRLKGLKVKLVTPVKIEI